MDANVLMTMISTVGFPICACVFLAIFYKQMDNNFRSDIKELSTNHRAEMEKVTEAINNNSMLIQKLIDKMDKEGD